MININKLTQNLTQMYPKPLHEDTFNALANNVDSGRKSRASSIPAHYIGVDQAKDGQARTLWEVSSQTQGKNVRYEQVVQIHVPIEGGLFSIAKGKWNPKQFGDALAKADVKVHCTCPDFYWSGMKYNLGPGGPKKGSLAPEQKSGVAGEKVPTPPPDIRDPERKHTMCKHLYAVFQVFKNNAFSIMGDARKYDADIETNDEITRDGDDGRFTLEKDVDRTKGVSEADQEIITTSLNRAAIDINAEQDVGSEEIIDERNEDTVETSEEVKDTASEEFIDDVNEQTELEDEIQEEEKDVGTEELIDEQNEIADEIESDEGVEDLIDDQNKNVVEEPEKKSFEDDEASVNDILNR